MGDDNASAASRVAMPLSRSLWVALRGTPLPLVILIACSVLGLASLGVWQISRGQQKHKMLVAYEQALHAPAQVLTAQTPLPAKPQMQPVRLRGHYLPVYPALLDNQFQGQRVGYDVWTLFALEDGAAVWVDRGWVPRGPNDFGQDPPAELMRAIHAVPSGEVELHGLLRALPEAGWHVAQTDCRGTHWPQIVEYPTLQDLRCVLKEVTTMTAQGEPLFVATTLRDGLVLLDADEPAGFDRHWQPAAGFPPERHYGYAVQWFALSLTLLGMSLWTLLKRSSK